MGYDGIVMWLSSFWWPMIVIPNEQDYILSFWLLIRIEVKHIGL